MVKSDLTDDEWHLVHDALLVAMKTKWALIDAIKDSGYIDGEAGVELRERSLRYHTEELRQLEALHKKVDPGITLAG